MGERKEGREDIIGKARQSKGSPCAHVQKIEKAATNC
jgi:hypothetical protein